MNRLLAVLREQFGQPVQWQYVHRQLTRLGFTASSSGKTFQRRTP